MSHRSRKATSKNTVSLKLLIDKKANRVLFAEAGKDFVDFLFTLLSLPLGTVIRLLQKPAAMIGCIGSLYESLENLNEAYMQPNKSKDSLLKPTVPLTYKANLPFLLPDTHHVQAEAEGKVFGCLNYNHFCVSYQRGAPCSYCLCSMNNELKIVNGKKINTTASSTETCGGGGEGGFVKGLVTYMVTDDLSVSPMSMISVVSLVNKFNVRGFSSLEERIVGFGIDERGAPCSYCLCSMTNELKIVDGQKINMTASSTETCGGGGGGEGGFVKGLVTYMVTDDLSVSPMSMISVVSLLNKFNVRSFSSLEEKIVGFGFDEGLELLKASLHSKAALTCVFLAKDEMKDAAAPN